MKPMQVVIVILALTAALLMAAAIRLYISMTEWRDEAERLDEQAQYYGRMTREMSADKLHYTLEKAEQEEIINYLRAENEALKIQLDRPPVLSFEAEPETAPANKASVPVIDWTFDRLPNGLTNTFRCEDYRLFAEGSEQWKLQRDCFTDPETGIRFYISGNKRYLCAAMASAYGVTIGNGFEVEFEGGDVINVIMADFKHPIADANADDFGDPDMNYLSEPTTSVLEFVFDKQAAPKAVHDYGGMFVEQFGGLFNVGYDIVNINFEGRVWEP